ncbi:MAG: GNAT family N-acetyltransferase [Methylomicrobium sp.]|nr:GNAT family N-acetyltransferase [Methylomicrobium sp.]
MNKIVEGKSLYLRKLESMDLDRTWEWLHRPDINSKIGVRIPFTKEQQKQWFAQLQNDKSKIVFAICHNCDDGHIGNVSLDMIDFRHRNARFSIFIADYSQRSKGFGTESLTLLEHYAFAKLNLHKIWCKTDANDPKILDFYKKLGFQQEGLFKEHEVKEGRFIDKVIFAKFEPEG